MKTTETKEPKYTRYWYCNSQILTLEAVRKEQDDTPHEQEDARV